MDEQTVERRRLNAYYCDKCLRYVVTEDVSEGVTPFFLACRVKGEPTDLANDCDGRMTSMMYPAQPWPTDHPDLVDGPTWEWYSPDAAERERLRREDPATLTGHVDRGGLLLRRKAGFSPAQGPSERGDG